MTLSWPYDHLIWPYNHPQPLPWSYGHLASPNPGATLVVRPNPGAKICTATNKPYGQTPMPQWLYGHHTGRTAEPRGHNGCTANLEQPQPMPHVQFIPKLIQNAPKIFLPLSSPKTGPTTHLGHPNTSQTLQKPFISPRGGIDNSRVPKLYTNYSSPIFSQSHKQFPRKILSWTF